MAVLVWTLVTVVIVACLVLSLVLPLASVSGNIDGNNQTMTFYFTKTCMNDMCLNNFNSELAESEKKTYGLLLSSFISIIVAVTILVLCKILMLAKVNFKICSLLNLLALVLVCFATGSVLYEVYGDTEKDTKVKLDVGSIMLIVGTGLLIVKKIAWMLMKH